MNELLRTWVLHHAHVHRAWLERLGTEPSAELVEPLMEGLVYDGLWLTKFPLLYTPTFGVERLDALQKGWHTGAFVPAEALALRPLVDADMLRFVLAVAPEAWDRRVEIFFGGRAMNKPLWNYWVGWLEQSTRHRARLGLQPSLFDTVFR